MGAYDCQKYLEANFLSLTIILEINFVKLFNSQNSMSLKILNLTIIKIFCPTWHGINLILAS